MLAPGIERSTAMARKKQTSSRVSSIGGSYLSITAERLRHMLDTDPDLLVNHIRSMAGSVTSQDENEG